jgi:uncharacterized protein
MTTPEEIIHDLYPKGSRATDILLAHSCQVRDKALAVARRVAHLKPDTDFIAGAAMLHDIGIYQTSAAGIGCHGDQAYIRHGIIGRNVLEKYGLHRHGLVCERHIGAGISQRDIAVQGLPLPMRDMLPLSIEEQIVCYADAFFSKSNGGCAHTLTEVLASLARFGRDKVERFMQWHACFDETRCGESPHAPH